MELTMEQIRVFRLRSHHLDRELPLSRLEEAAGACGLQNSPPGAWETAMFQRLEGCTLQALQDALYREKRLLQAWSFRGAPVVFPTRDSGVFLTPLVAREGEDPWIYTRGISGALEFLGMTFEELLPRVRTAAGWLEGRTVKSKEELDRVLAARVTDTLPEEKRPLWNAPSMYGSPDRQTVGGAVVSFLLRPCAFQGLVVFGEREGSSPTFTSFRSWVGSGPEPCPEGEKELVRRFLHCYGPSSADCFAQWLGSSPRQARRLWAAAGEEMEPVQVGKKTRWLLRRDRKELPAGEENRRLLLLGAHDPYLDIRDREVILEDKARQRAVWRTVANPGVVLLGGRAAGIWKGKAQGSGMECSVMLWEPLERAERERLAERAEAYAVFRGLSLKKLLVEEA